MVVLKIDTAPGDVTVPVGQEVWRWAEQTFKLSANATITGITVQLYKYGNPAANMVVAIKETQGGAVLTSVIVTAASLTTSKAEYTLTFDSPIELIANTTYRVEFSTTSYDNSNFYVVDLRTGNQYADGTMNRWDGSVWSNPSVDYDIPLSLLGPEIIKGRFFQMF